MNKVNLNTISLNSSSLNTIGEVKMGGASGGGGLDAIGVFIYDIDGKLTAPENWNTANNDKAVGVYLGTDTYRFVMSKKSTAIFHEWGGYGVLIQDIVTTTSSSISLLDFDGEGNTRKIIEQLNGVIDENGIEGAPACEACMNFIVNNKQCYLGALGEWKIWRDNQQAVDDALFMIGGNRINSNPFSSTQYDKNKVWYFDYMSTYEYYTPKSTIRLIKPFFKP